MTKQLKIFSLTGKKAIAVLVAIILVAILAVDVTLAYLIAYTDAFDNVFDPPILRLSLEGYDDITNNGDVPVYVRALGVINWLSTEDEHTILSETPQPGVDYSIDFVTEGWFLASDGFYYYENILNPGEQIQLMTHAYQLTEKDGYEMKFEILSSGIQAYPLDAIAMAWPAVRVTDSGTLVRADEA